MQSVLQRHLWFFFLLPVALGLALPAVGLLFEPYAIPLLFALMTLSLLDVKLKESLKAGLNTEGLCVLAVQYVVFGFLASLAALFFPRELFIGFVITLVAPSGITIPAMVDLHGGNTAKALSLTTLSNLAAPFMIPLLVPLLAGRSVAVDAGGLFQNVAFLVFLPLVLAALLNRTQAAARLDNCRKPLNVVLLVLLVWGLTAKSASFFYANAGTVLLASIALFAVSIIGFAIGSGLGKSKRDKIAYATLCYYKNNTLSVTLLATLFTPAAAAIAVANMLVGRILVAFTRFLVL